MTQDLLFIKTCLQHEKQWPISLLQCVPESLNERFIFLTREALQTYSIYCIKGKKSPLPWVFMAKWSSTVDISDVSNLLCSFKENDKNDLLHWEESANNKFN